LAEECVSNEKILNKMIAMASVARSMLSAPDCRLDLPAKTDGLIEPYKVPIWASMPDGAKGPAAYW
jgi:hypothetical protein